jgi:ATP-dependent DNA helicase DinG
MTTPPEIRLPRCPAVIAGVRQVIWLSADGEVETPDRRTVAERLAGDASVNACPFVCHAGAMARRLEAPAFQALDLLELFAFVRPAQFTLPTPRGLAESLGLALPGSPESEAASLLASARALLADLVALATNSPERAIQTAGQAQVMALAGWSWGPSVLAALGMAEGPQESTARAALRVWNQLPEWQDGAPEPAPSHLPVAAKEAKNRLAELLGGGAEDRDGQRAYVSTCVHAFAPRNHRDEPNLVLAEAGTGIGKTLGYIAPASLWAERNEGAVWISTYTRNLQRQLDGELDRLYPIPAEKDARVVIRKGRENYLCLLNMADAVTRLQPASDDAIALGLVARWAAASRDGDMVGGDFPAWLTDLFGHTLTTNLTDTRGECIYSACDHYRRCFIEHTVRRARRADLVVANHALVMVQAAMGSLGGGGDDGTLPTRYVFDEGHQMFNAADSAFAAHLSGRETADLRRWLIGAEDGARRRARGLKARAADLIDGNGAAEEFMDEILSAARALPGSGWPTRIGGGVTVGPTEAFLAFVRQQVYARDANADQPYGLETQTLPPVPDLLDAATKLKAALTRLEKPLVGLSKCLLAMLDEEAEDLESATRARIDGLVRSITRRGLQPLAAWKSMLTSLHAETPPDFVDWFDVERIAGRDFDVGYRRHWLDPTRPLAETVFQPAHGVLVTSATLRDHTDGDSAETWAGAEARTGAGHLPMTLTEAEHPSPFNYPENTRVLVVGDVNRNSADQVAAAYRELFLAANGGALGLFTAIHRLRAVHRRIAGPLEEAGLSLLAQHVDAMDTGTLIDIFRAEEDTCLFGTDAVRDGVDVPGRSLRLIVFDRVPWPRPSLVHKARKAAFGGRTYDEMLARLRLKQAYGRLLRRATDRGVFVMLERAMPSRLGTAFPEGVELQRVGLAEALSQVRGFLQTDET